MKKVLITLLVAFATTISAFAQSIDTLRVDSVSFTGLNPMTEARIHFTYVNMTDTSFIHVNFGVTPNFQNNSLNGDMVPAGTGTYSVVLTGLTANTSYSVRGFFAWPFPIPMNSNVFTFTTASCNFQAGVTVNGNDTICQGQTVSLTASPAGASYTWHRNGMPLSGETNQTLTANQSGTYTVYVNDVCMDDASTTVTVVNPVATVTPNGPTTFCVGGSVDLTANNGSSYLWNNGSTAQTVTASAGNYYVTVTDANGCSATSQTTSVSSITAGATVTAGGPTTFCEGGSVTLYSSSQTGNVWSTGAITQAITVSETGTYNVVVSNGGCSGTSPSVSVTVNPLPSAPIVTASGPIDFCEGGSVLLSTTSNTAYNWNNGSVSGSILVNQTGNYSVNVIDANGCQSPESSVTTVTVNPMPTPEISANGPTTFCAGGSVQLSAFGAGTYNWNNGSLGNAQTVMASASGTYIVTVTNQYGCSASASQSVTVNPLPAPTVTASGSTTFCEGGSVTLNASGSGTHTWNTGHTGSSLTVFAEGTYNVTAVDANGCEGISNNLMIWVNPNPEVGIMQAGPNSSSITANVFGGTAPYEYLWSTGDITPSILVFQNGQYGVNVTDANGCSGSGLTSVHGVGIEEILEALTKEIDHIDAHDLSGRKIQSIRTGGEYQGLISGSYILRGYDREGNLLLTEKVYK